MVAQAMSWLMQSPHLRSLPLLRCLLAYLCVWGFILLVTWAGAFSHSSNLPLRRVLSIQHSERPQLFALLLRGVQVPSGRPGTAKVPCLSAQSYYKLSRSRSGPLGWTVGGGAAHDHLCAGEVPGGTILRASLPSSGSKHVETVQKRNPSLLARVSTGNGVSSQRLLRIRRRNIRFLCSSRKNRMRGLLSPAKATSEEAAENHDSAEEAHLLRLMQLKDPLVKEVPVRRWRTQWFPSFARRSLVPLVRAAARCDAIVEVRDARLPLLSRCNLRVLQLPKPRAVILTHADQKVRLAGSCRASFALCSPPAQASPLATRRWQRHFRRESRQAAALELHAELTRARKQLPTAGLLRTLWETCPLAPRVPYLFIDAREPAAIVRVQRLLRSLVKRHRRYRRDLNAFRSLCKQAAAAAPAGGVDAPYPSAQLTRLAVPLKGTADEASHAGKVPTKASLQQKKPLRILIVGVPNVGKSKIANCLVGRKVARSYRWPGTTQSVNLHRQPLSLARVGDMSRSFDVIDTPGFIAVHPREGKRKKRLTFSEQQQLQQRLGTGARQGQLDLGLFFDFTHPRPSPDDLALLAAFHMLPHSCLFTIEEAAVALGNAFFRMRKLLPAASDLHRVMSRYKINAEAFAEDTNMGVQLLLTLAEKRHHSNEGAAAQRLLSDFTQGYLGRHTFELPAMLYPSPGDTSTTKRTILDGASGKGNTISVAERPTRQNEHLILKASDTGPRGSSASDRENKKQSQARAQTTERETAEGRCWTMRRHGDRLSFVLDTRCRLETSRTNDEGALGLGALTSAHGQFTALPTSALNEHKQSDAEGYNKSSKGLANCAGGRQQQQQLLAPGWLEGAVV